MTAKSEPHVVKGRAWEWQGKGAWHFVTIDAKIAQAIKNDWHWPRRGFGSIPVLVTVGKTAWKTSIFPEKGGTYLLPLKKDVRKKEGIAIGKDITISLEVIV